jgi:prepilin-type N-terminal cleavage/methylation domain-containing protein
MNHPTIFQKRTHGFTLIELLTVIAIIGVLAGILIPVIGSARKTAASTAAVSNIRQIGMANMLYTQENLGEIIGYGETPAHIALANIAAHLSPDLSEYSQQTGNADWPKWSSTLRDVVDPNVPKALATYSGLPFTVSFNSIFNVSYGRSVEGKAPWGAPRTIKPRRMLEFEFQADTIYALSGSYEFNANTAANQAFLAEPTARQSIYYLHGNNDSTPAVFLDGHAEMLTYPITPEKINPSLR